MITSKTVYRSSSIKRKRRTNQQLSAILEATRAIIAEEQGAITIRHLFYRLVALKLLEKTEREYDKLSGYLMKWRRSKEIPWSAFADNTRYYYGARGYLSMADALRDTCDSYRRNLWASQNAFVEIWCEKDAIASIIASVANSFGVRTFPLHGFSSGTALYNAAETFNAAMDAGKNVHIYYFGDYDPSGLYIDRSALKNLREDHGVDPDFQRVAVTPSEIERYDLPTRPPKKTDSRSKNFQGESVEIDAMPMDALRAMVEQCIVQHIDPDTWYRELEIEKNEKAGLSELIAAYQEADA
jgi:hypothetical protein